MPQLLPCLRRVPPAGLPAPSPALSMATRMLRALNTRRTTMPFFSSSFLSAAACTLAGLKPLVRFLPAVPPPTPSLLPTMKIRPPLQRVGPTTTLSSSQMMRMRTMFPRPPLPTMAIPERELIQQPLLAMLCPPVLPSKTPTMKSLPSALPGTATSGRDPHPLPTTQLLAVATSNI